MKTRQREGLARASTVTPTPPDWSCIFRMENAIYRVWTLTDLVVEHLTKQLEASESDIRSKSAVGLQALEIEALNALEDAFNDVTTYCRHLRNQTQERK